MFKKITHLLVAGALSIGLLFGVSACTVDELTALEGVLQNADSLSGEVTVKLKDGSTVTFNLSNVNVQALRDTLGKLTLQPGDGVVVGTDGNGNVRTLSARNVEVDGTIKAVTADGITITAENGVEVALKFTPQTQIKLGNGAVGKITDLVADQNIEAKYDVTTKEMSRIEIVVPDTDVEVKGTIKTIDATAKTLVITTRAGTDTAALKVVAGTELDLRGTDVFATLKVGMEVEVEYDTVTGKILELEQDEDDDDDDRRSHRD
jgi:hypothetical protein